ncbi:MAG: YbaY family lipoprotein [Chloroflexi bacterium]|nr:YbaY family lipoprotein [Chloroflexota bacterium]
MWKLASLLSLGALVVMTVPAILLTLVWSGSDVNAISGTVRYMDGEVELPLGSCVEVVLVDVSGDEPLAVALGRQVIDDANTLPVDFRVSYNRDQLTPGATHELWVAVRHDGELLYTAASDYFVELDGTVSGIDVAVAPLATP